MHIFYTFVCEMHAYSPLTLPDNITPSGSVLSAAVTKIL